MFKRQTGAYGRDAFPVTYNDTRLIEIHRGIIERMLAQISLPRVVDLGEDAFMGCWAELLIKIGASILRANAYFKHEAYVNEREFRFIQIHPLDSQPLVTKLRTRSYSSIRYQEFDWKDAGRDVLKKIVIGPAADVENATAFAKESLLLADQQAVAITCSAVPYRAT